MTSLETPIHRELSPGGAWIFYLLVLILILTPLPFGAVYQWSWAGLAILVGLLLLASTPNYLARTRVVAPWIKALWLPALLYGLVVVWVGIQASGLTPGSWDHPIWAQTSRALEEDIPGAISLNPYATRSEFVKMLAYAGIFWLAVVYGRDRRRARAGLWLLSLAGVLYALYGLFAFLTGIGERLWLHEMPNAHHGVSSTFVNRNMYVDYATFGLLSVLSLLFDWWLEFSKSDHRKRSFWRDFGTDRGGRVLLLATMGLVLLAALTMTGSRGGVVAAAMASGVLTLLLLRQGLGDRWLTRKGFGLGGVFLVGWGLAFLLAGGHLGSRLIEVPEDALGGRPAGYQMILRAIGEAPWTGFGAGNSLDVFYLYNNERIWSAFNYAHNVYLGAAVEFGLPAAALLFLAVALITLSCLRGVRRRRDRIYPALGFSVSIFVALHGLVDSPLYLAANAATFSFLLGLAYAQSWPSLGRVPSWSEKARPDRSDRGPQEPVEARSE